MIIQWVCGQRLKVSTGSPGHKTLSIPPMCAGLSQNSKRSGAIEHRSDDVKSYDIMTSNLQLAKYWMNSLYRSPGGRLCRPPTLSVFQCFTPLLLLWWSRSVDSPDGNHHLSGVLCKSRICTVKQIPASTGLAIKIFSLQ